MGWLFPFPFQARPPALSQEWGLIELPLLASLTKIKVGRSGEGARQRTAEKRMVCLSCSNFVAKAL